MSIRHMAALTIALAATSFFSRAFAKEGPTMNPGKWEVKTIQSNSMQPKEKVTTTTTCVKEDKNPLESIIEAGKCKVSNQETEGHTVKWDMQCGEEGNFKGSGSFTADGDSGEGVMEMTTNIKEMKLNVKNTWSGKRVGDCD